MRPFHSVPSNLAIVSLIASASPILASIGFVFNCPFRVFGFGRMLSPLRRFCRHSVRFCALLPSHCSPFVTLTTLSTVLFLLMPDEPRVDNSPPTVAQNDHFIDGGKDQGKETAERPNDSTYAWLSAQIIPAEEEFSCGGGPFSFMAASLISISCHRHQIHLCCEHHDECYDQRNISQSLCDNIFCDCLGRISSNSYCQNIAHPGLCLATRTFGHLFHWTSYCESSDCAASAALKGSDMAKNDTVLVR